MNEKEAELVTEEFVKDDSNYNLCPGGHGGWGYINSNEELRVAKNQFAIAQAQKCGLERYGVDNYSKTEEFKLEHSERMKILHSLGNMPLPPSWTGRTHNEESKKKIGEAASKNQKGSGNSQFNTIWITNGIENKKIKKCEEIPENWWRGRTVGNPS